VAGSEAVPAEIVLSPRLSLIALPALVIAGVLDGRPDAFLVHVGVGYPEGWAAEDRNVLERRRRQIAEGVDHRWLLRAAVTRTAPAMVGRAGFHGPPDADGMVEIGYRIDPGHRRRGFGFECALALVESAERLPGVSVVRASIAPDNAPSLRIATRLGFAQIGEQIDEIDGLELVFERRASTAARG
jgi:[ribosomal protein S5]-alanine N-acetyltransferase